MMHFFEPEMESRWPFSASWDSRVSGILNDASSCGFPAGNTEIQQSPGSNDPFPTLDIDLLNVEYFTGSSDSLGCIPAVMTSGSRIMSGSGNKQTTDHVMEHTKMRDATLMEEEIAPRDVIRKQKAAVVPCTKKPQQVSKKARFTTLEMEKNVKIPSKRNQKLGDKITALQQLVSPFGKTDTASVLQEATIYIKDLLEQIQTLTSPYCEMEFSTKLLQQHQQKHGGETLGLHKRGLCLVPVSDSIINLTNQAPNDAHTDERMTRRVGGYAPWS